MPDDSELFTSESVGSASYDLAEVYPLSVSSVSTIPWIRRIRGSADLIAGLTIIAAFVVELSDQVRRGEFEPLFHFSYLTNQTNYSNIVVLLAGAYLAFSRTQDTVLYATIRANFVAYAVIVGTVYNALLREPDHFGFHNEVTHVAIPVYLAADWLIRNNRPRISWNTAVDRRVLSGGVGGSNAPARSSYRLVSLLFSQPQHPGMARRHRLHHRYFHYLRWSHCGHGGSEPPAAPSTQHFLRPRSTLRSRLQAFSSTW